jgi:hypothetical protein
MNALNQIIKNGFSNSSIEALKIAITGNEFSDRGITFAVIKKEFDECEDLETLKAFSKIMIDEVHVLDVEPKMISIMGEDDFFDFIG